jgi:hypothetical protein
LTEAELPTVLLPFKCGRQQASTKRLKTKQNKGRKT